MWDLVGNPEDRFSHNGAQVVDKIVVDQRIRLRGK